ncbi:hypothetical protein MMPV_009899 [Pyropia vietnamensis]
MPEDLLDVSAWALDVLRRRLTSRLTSVAAVATAATPVAAANETLGGAPHTPGGGSALTAADWAARLLTVASDLRRWAAADGVPAGGGQRRGGGPPAAAAAATFPGVASAVAAGGGDLDDGELATDEERRQAVPSPDGEARGGATSSPAAAAAMVPSPPPLPPPALVVVLSRHPRTASSLGRFMGDAAAAAATISAASPRPSLTPGMAALTDAAAALAAAGGAIAWVDTVTAMEERAVSPAAAAAWAAVAAALPASTVGAVESLLLPPTVVPTSAVVAALWAGRTQRRGGVAAVSPQRVRLMVPSSAADGPPTPICTLALSPPTADVWARVATAPAATTAADAADVRVPEWTAVGVVAEVGLRLSGAATPAVAIGGSVGCAAPLASVLLCLAARGLALLMDGVAPPPPAVPWCRDGEEACNGDPPPRLSPLPAVAGGGPWALLPLTASMASVVAVDPVCVPSVKPTAGAVGWARPPPLPADVPPADVAAAAAPANACSVVVNLLDVYLPAVREAAAAKVVATATAATTTSTGASPAGAGAATASAAVATAAGAAGVRLQNPHKRRLLPPPPSPVSTLRAVAAAAGSAASSAATVEHPLWEERPCAMPVPAAESAALAAVLGGDAWAAERAQDGACGADRASLLAALRASLGVDDNGGGGDHPSDGEDTAPFFTLDVCTAVAAEAEAAAAAAAAATADNGGDVRAGRFPSGRPASPPDALLSRVVVSTPLTAGGLASDYAAFLPCLPHTCPSLFVNALLRAWPTAAAPTPGGSVPARGGPARRAVASVLAPANAVAAGVAAGSTPPAEARLQALLHLAVPLLVRGAAAVDERPTKAARPVVRVLLALMAATDAVPGGAAVNAADTTGGEGGQEERAGANRSIPLRVAEAAAPSPTAPVDAFIDGPLRTLFASALPRTLAEVCDALDRPPVAPLVERVSSPPPPARMPERAAPAVRGVGGDRKRRYSADAGPAGPRSGASPAVGGPPRRRRTAAVESVGGPCSVTDDRSGGDGGGGGDSKGRDAPFPPSGTRTASAPGRSRVYAAPPVAAPSPSQGGSCVESVDATRVPEASGGCGAPLPRSALAVSDGSDGGGCFGSGGGDHSAGGGSVNVDGGACTGNGDRGLWRSRRRRSWSDDSLTGGGVGDGGGDATASAALGAPPLRLTATTAASHDACSGGGGGVGSPRWRRSVVSDGRSNSSRPIAAKAATTTAATTAAAATAATVSGSAGVGAVHRRWRSTSDGVAGGGHSVAGRRSSGGAGEPPRSLAAARVADARRAAAAGVLPRRGPPPPCGVMVTLTGPLAGGGGGATTR